MTRGNEISDPLTGQHLKFVQRAADTGGEFLHVEVRLSPGGYVPRHAHLRQDERVTVLSGEVAVKVGRREQVLHRGESAEVGRRHLHRVWNAGPVDARFLLDVRPARRMEGAIRTVVRVTGWVNALTRRSRAR